MKYLMEEMTKDEFASAIDEGALVIIPVGSVEEHGPHLPLATDCFQPLFVAKRIAAEIKTVVAPLVYYGNCGSTAPFRGSVSVSFDALRYYMRDIVASFLSQGARNILILSGHAGRMHMAALKLAVSEAWEMARKPEAGLFVLSDYDFAYELPGQKGIPEWDGHAGTIETARIMEIRPDLVKEPLPEDFKAEFPRFSPVYDSTKVIPDGYWGAPARATAETGKWADDHILERLLEFLKENMV